MAHTQTRTGFLKAFALSLTLAAFGTGTALAGGGHGHHHHDHKAADKGTMEGVMVINATSPAAAPGIKTSAVYMMLENKSGMEIELVAIESPAFAMGHIHKTAMVNGLMTMEPVAQLGVPNGTKVMFEPGGLHLMLMGAKESFKPGDAFPVKLVFSSGMSVETTVSVVKPGHAAHDHHHGHDHGNMKTH